MKNFDAISDVFSQLNMVLLLRESKEQFRVSASRPAWWQEYAASQAEEPIFLVSDDHPFLHNFLIDAERFWSSNQRGHCTSGVWEPSFLDSTRLLEAYAMRIGENSLIILEELRYTRADQHDLIRASRRTQLELLRDIARRQQLELELRNARDTAIQLENTMSQLLANTSHELRTPLSGLLGMLEMAIDKNDDTSGHVSDALKAAQGLHRIVNDLLDFAALEAGKPSLELTSINVAEFLLEVERDFRPAAQERGLVLRATGISELDSITVTTDRTRLRQVLNNLVDNAIRYTDEGGITIALTQDDPTSFAISVTDSGRGISEEDQQLIFDAFRRGSSSRINDGGTGLGLAIVSELTKLLGGTLSLQSSSGRGTTFRTEFSAGEEGLEESHSSSSNTSQPSDDYSAIPRGLRVLIAEDNEANRKFLFHILGQLDAPEIEAVENGIDLVERTHSKEYDVILTDCRMSGLDGLEASNQIRKRERKTGGHIPIIAVTAHAARLDTEPFLSSGIDDIVIKPFTRAELFGKIAALVKRKEASSNEQP